MYYLLFVFASSSVVYNVDLQRCTASWESHEIKSQRANPACLIVTRRRYVLMRPLQNCDFKSSRCLSNIPRVMF